MGKYYLYYELKIFSSLIDRSFLEFYFRMIAVQNYFWVINQMRVNHKKFFNSINE